jgi:hypothetical protein
MIVTMGILGRLRQTASKAADDAWVAVYSDRRFAVADALAAEGNPSEAVVTGIHRRSHQDSGTTTKLRLEWFDPSPRVGGLLLTAELPPVLRLGSSVAIRTDDHQVALDFAAMAEAPAAREIPQRTLEDVPEQGIDDTTLDHDVLRRIRTWPAEDAVVTSVERVKLLGIAADNWHLQLRRSDGSTTQVNRAAVPSYCRWFVAPGATLPVVVDPKKPARSQVDWFALAERMATDGGRWQDPPPVHSIAADLLGSRSSAGATVPDGVSSLGRPADSTPGPGAADAIEGVTLETFALVQAALVHSRVPVREHDDWATEHHGVPPGRWSSVKQQWESRTRSDWQVGVAFGEAYSAAQKEVRKRPR